MRKSLPTFQTILLPAEPRSRQGRALLDSQHLLLFGFLLLSYPLLDLATVGVRSLILFNAVKQAARQASHAAVFRGPTDGTKTKQDAVNIAYRMLSEELSARAGIKVNQLKVGIVVKNADQSRSGPFYNPLKPADIEVFKKIYYLQVEVSAQIDPLFSYPMVGAIPGLTTAYKTDMVAESVFEHPLGLTQ